MPVAVTPPVIEAKSPAGLTIRMPQNKKRKIICFSDFDGTIALQDTGHLLFDNHGCGSARRKALNEQIETGERSFREVSEEMYASLNVPFEDGFEVLEQQLKMDPDFERFHQFCVENKIPFNVISAGLKPILRRILDGFLGEEASSHIEIVANDANISHDGAAWEPVWRHESEMGHDKSLSMTEARKQAELQCEDGSIPLIVFIGDGVSDLPAAKHADVLFARRGLLLEEYCVENKIAYIPYDSFADIQNNIERIIKEDMAKTGGLGTPVLFNPRANLWRRMSSQTNVPRMVAMSPSKEERMFLWPEAFTELKGTAIDEIVDTTTTAVKSS
ncbi:hypothetical protein G7046_g3674 [Stylonectria norvegica]|nr:hypothetical protein G7046_g3674 [Stylonectria norvegica]